MYLIPSQPYEYHHPEGTGKEVPPFTSLWFCGIGKERVATVKEYWDSVSWKKNNEWIKPTLAVSLESLKMSGAIPTQKRPNPRQRKKKRQHAQQQQQQQQVTSVVSSKNQSDTSNPMSHNKRRRPNPSNSPSHQSNVRVRKVSKKKSKHRDNQGHRQRKRF